MRSRNANVEIRPLRRDEFSSKSIVRHGRTCSGHPRLCFGTAFKAWMPATSAGRFDGNLTSPLARAIGRRPSELWQRRRNFFGVESYCEPTLPTIWPILGGYLRAGREVPVASFCSLRRDFSPVRLVRVDGCFMPADECLTFARECRRWALETKDKDVREAFLEMAKVWTQLGSQQQRLSSDVEDPPPSPRAS